MDSGGMTGDPMGGMFSGGGEVPDWLAMLVVAPHS